MKEKSKVELYERIRRDHRLEEVGIRELARRHGVHRRTVRDALEHAVPTPRRTAERDAPAMGPHRDLVRGWLKAEIVDKVPVKQRHTARRVWQRLTEEHGAQVSESTVRLFVAEVRAELAQVAAEVTVVQEHALGAEAEIDFGEFVVWIAGEQVKLWMFIMRLSASGRSFVVAFAHQAQEAFFEGHVLAFAHFGGVPTGQIRYDNLKPAVIRILQGRDRTENERFTALRSHYGFDAFFCEPGIEGAHEKGGVEGEVGRFRRRHLVPVPEVASLAEVNELIAAGMARDDGRHIERRPLTVGEAFELEAPWLQPLPVERFDSAKLLTAKVDTKARICVLQSFYSVPVRLARRRVQVRLGPHHLEVLDPVGGAVVAVHTRSLHKGTQDLLLDHYLEILTRKPGAMAGSAALARAREMGVFTATHQRFWDAARRRHGDGPGTCRLIEVLLLQRRMAAGDVMAGIDAAMAVDATDPALVAIEARRHADAGLAPVVRIDDALSRYDRPAPSLASYDQLLHTDGALATVTDIGDRS
jgi:transposase